MYTYPARFTPEESGFVVTVPDIPEVITEGDSIEEATEYAIDAIELVLGEYMRRGPKSLAHRSGVGATSASSSFRCQCRNY